MKEIILNLFRRFMTQGITPELDPSEVKKIKILNTLLAIAYANGATFAPLFFLVGAPKAGFAQVIYAILVFINHMILLSGRVALAKLFFMVSGYYIITGLSLMLGPYSLLSLYFFAVCSLPFLLFSLKDGIFLYLSLAISIFCTALTGICYELGFYENLPLDEHLLRILAICLAIGAFGSFLGCIWAIFYNNEIAEGALKTRNKEVKDLLDNLQQGIFTIDQDLHILPGYSKHTENILGKQNIVGLKVTDIMEESHLGVDKMAQIAAVFSTVIGEESFAFDLNHHLLPTEASFAGKKTFAFYWNPIVEDTGIISKLMVSILDVSNERLLAEQSKAKEKELALIGHIMQIGKEAATAYCKSSLEYIHVIKENFSHETIDQKAFTLIYRSLHTIKGNGRTYDFKEIVDICHNCETSLQSYFANPTADEHMHFTEMIHNLEDKVQEYVNILKVFDGVNEEKTRIAELADRTVSELEGVKSESEIVKRAREFVTEYTLEVSDTIDNILENQAKAAKKVAVELGKETPKIIFETHDIRIKKEYHQSLQDIFNHILRNSVDHGISADPEKQGMIWIDSTWQGEEIVIAAKDSGDGIDLFRIAKKAEEKGIVTAGKSDEELADLIFAPNFSTKEKVTTVSGRGVGMDFVRSATEAIGGKALLVLGSKSEQVGGCRKFEIHLIFPRKIAVHV